MAISKVLAHPHLVETLFWLYILVLRETQKLFFVHSTEMDIESITKPGFLGWLKSTYLQTLSENYFSGWRESLLTGWPLDFLYKFTLMKKNKCILLSIAHIHGCPQIHSAKWCIFLYWYCEWIYTRLLLLGKILQNNNPNRYENNKNKKKKKWWFQQWNMWFNRVQPTKTRDEN